MPSISHQILHACTWQLQRFVDLERRHIPVLRPRLDFLAGVLRLPWGVRGKQLRIGHMSAEWLVPATPSDTCVLLYLHGGGYAVGSPATHRGMAGRLAQTSGLKTLIIDYRLAPEHPFPAALEDASIAYHWLLAQGYQVLLAGDSAGGGLCMSLQLMLQQMEVPLPLACVCFSPWVDLSFASESAKRYQPKDPIVRASKIRDWAFAYADQTSLDHPFVSPIFGELGNLAPLLIHASTEEVLTDDAKRLAKRVQEQGGEVSIDMFHQVQHVWQLFWFFVPEANDSLRQAGTFLHTHWAQETPQK
ncbi:MAG: alpha/beta hydrolase [Bacteroidota bacterium]